MASGKNVAGAIKSLFNAMVLQLRCARVLHESLLVPVLLYGSETMILREKERSRISIVRMDNLRRVLGIKRMDSEQIARIRELFEVTNRVDIEIDESVSRCFGY